MLACAWMLHVTIGCVIMSRQVNSTRFQVLFAHGCKNCKLDEYQDAACITIIEAVECTSTPTEDKVRMYFMDGPGGTGKTFTVQHVLDVLRLRGHICLVCATTALAVGLYEEGHTLHALGKLSIMKRSSDSVSTLVKESSQRAELLRDAALIVIDELCSLHRSNLEVFVDLLERIGSKATVLLTGDFRQIAPVVAFGSRASVADASPIASHV
jgi:PIF1-like helicase